MKTKVSSSDVKEHGRINKPAMKPSIPFKPNADVSISEHNWTFEKHGNKLKLSLGNLSDAGWFWNGDETDLNGFLIRLNSSKVRDEFLAEMEKNKITFESLKPLLLKAIEKGDGIYELSGDNLLWKFGEGLASGRPDADYIKERFEELVADGTLRETQKQMFEDETINNFSFTFEDFEKTDYAKDIKESMQKMAKSSKSFKEYFNQLEDDKDTRLEDVNEYLSNQEYEAIQKATENLGGK